MVYLKRQLAWQKSFSARHFILACHSGKFDVAHGAECPPVELRVEIVLSEESYQFGAIYKRKRHRIISCYTSSNSLCGSVVDRMATMNLIYECIIVVLTS